MAAIKFLIKIAFFLILKMIHFSTTNKTEKNQRTKYNIPEIPEPKPLLLLESLKGYM